MVSDMVKKSILVTGANGFIGANLCNFLQKKGYDVSGLVRMKADLSLLSNKQKLIYCDFEDIQKLENIVNDFDIVIHLAAMTKAKSFKALYEANVLLTEKIVNIVNESEKCSQLLFISSQAAVGPSTFPTNDVRNAPPPFVRGDKGGLMSSVLSPPCPPHKCGGKRTENDIEKPISWYGISKYLAEKAVKKCEKSWTIIRPASVYGPGDKDFLFYFKMVDSHLAPIPGTQDKYISLIYVFDLIKIIEKCLKSDNVNNFVLHASDDMPYSIEEFVAVLSSAMNKKCFVLRLPDSLIKKVASVMEFIYSFTPKTPLLNSQKAMELAQESWVLGSERNSDTSISPHIHGGGNELYKNLKKTYLWYRENRFL